MPNEKYKPKTPPSEVKVRSKLDLLEASYRRWRAYEPPEDKRKPLFGFTWLKMDGLESLNKWAENNFGGIEFLVEQSTNRPMKVDFEKPDRHEHYTKETLVAEIEKAHEQWLRTHESAPQHSRPKFNTVWLTCNGFRGAYNSARRQFGGINNVIEWCSQQTKDDFIKEEKFINRLAGVRQVNDQGTEE